VSFSPVAPDQAVLSRELADFLHELAGAVQRHTMYPAGHPLLGPAVAAVQKRLQVLFLERKTVALGVGPGHFVVNGAKTDVEQATLRDLAARLHGRNIGGLKLRQGVTPLELGSFLAVLAAEQGATEHDEPDWQWPHLQLYPLRYDHLELFDEELADPESKRFGGKWAAQLWVDLAQVVLGDDLSDEAAAETQPEQLAAALNAAKDPAVGRKFISSLRELADACRSRGRSEVLAIQRELSRMIASLDAEVLRRLLDLGGDWAEQRKFLEETANVLSAETVVRLIAAAAETQGRSLSPALLQLLSKMAMHVDAGPAASRPKAELILRQQLDQLLRRWEEQQRRGALDEYAARLSLLPPAPSEHDPVLVYGCEPQRMLMMSVELGEVGPGTRRAVERFVGTRQVGPLLDLLDRVPASDPVVQELRRLVHSRFVVQGVLSAQPVDCDTLARLVPRTGLEALPALLDALAASDDRRVRGRLLDIIAALGPGIASDLIARIPGAPWYVQRNMVKLLTMLPDGVGVPPLQEVLNHGDARVRLEAIKLLLRDPTRRADALRRALDSSDPSTVRLGVQAAADGCPKEIAPVILRHLDGDLLDDRLRATAIRAIAPVNDVRVLRYLVQAALAPSPVPFFRRLRPKSRTVLAAVQALAAHWRGYPEAEPVVRRALRHRDGEIRKAAYVESEGPAVAVPPRVII